MTVKSETKLSLSYVIVYVRDTRKALSFYRDTLGLTVKVDDQDWIELETGAATLALHKQENAPVERSQQAVIVFSVDDIHITYNHLKTAGVKFEKEPHQVCEAGDHVGMSADFKDPDGNPLSVFGMVPRK